jgi:competence protein ComEA
VRVSGESVRDRLASLSRAELIGVVVVAAITLAGAGLWYSRSLPKPVELTAEPAPPVPAPGSATPAVAPTPILVDVAGWVRHPGVYEFVTGDRVIDALDAAGGARPGAELQALNLAAPLVDGTQVVVPKHGQTPAVGVAPGSEGGSSGALVNVNTATADELESLPGIGEVTAQAIIDYRTENGPFSSVDELLDVSGIGDVTLENIRELVTV